MLLIGIFLAIFLSAIVGAIGVNRKIGFGLAFLLSLILSPLIGLIITLASGRKENIEHEQQLNSLKSGSIQNISVTSDDILKVKYLLDSGIITQDEFDKIKQRLLERLNNSNENKIKEEESIEYNYPKIINEECEIITPVFGKKRQECHLQFEDDKEGVICQKLKDNTFYFIDKQYIHYYETKEDCIVALYSTLIGKGKTKKGYIVTYS